MEYSVYDLIKILLRRWYVILIAMCLVGGLSVVTAQRSYQNALSDYEAYTAETVSAPQETGTLVAVYQLSYEVTDVSKYVDQAKTKSDFMQKYAQSAAGSGYASDRLPSIYDEAASAYAAVSADFSKLLTDGLTMQKAQALLDAQKLTEPPTAAADGTVTPNGGPVVLSNHLAAEQLDASTLRLTVTGLDEAGCRAALEAYLQGMNETGTEAFSMTVTQTQTACDYLAQPAQYTETALLSQTVMQKPQQAPILVKTIGTAAMFAFVFACFGILLVAFIRDEKAAKVKTEAHGAS